MARLDEVRRVCIAMDWVGHMIFEIGSSGMSYEA